MRPQGELDACWRITTALGGDLPTFLQAVEKRAGVTLIAGVRPFARGMQPRAKTIGTPATEQEALSDFVRKSGGE